MCNHLHYLLFALIAIVLLPVNSPAAMNLNSTRHDVVHVVPAPGPVTIDGDLSDWDKSGEFFTYRFEEEKSSYYFQGYMMYDAANLYIAAHVGDSTPMMNMHNPATDAIIGWDGDALQVHLSTSAKLGWPLAADTYRASSGDPTSISDNIMCLCMWYYTPEHLPCLQIQYGMDYHGMVINPPGYQGAYKKDADGRGYTLEYAISWKLLHAADNPPKGSDRLACTWHMLWGDPQGRHCAYDLADIRNPNDGGLVYQTAGCWGQAIYEKTGHLPKGTVVTHEEQHPVTGAGFYPIHYTVPGAGKEKVSMQISDAKGHTVRWLLGDAERNAGANTELWNGLDDANNPLPAGQYTVHWCYFRNVKGKLVATADNPGQPPYYSSDGTGSWAGDPGSALDACANATHVFLAYVGAEAGPDMLCATTAGRKIWGNGDVMELGSFLLGLCTDGHSLYGLQGNPYYYKIDKAGFFKASCATGNHEIIGNTGCCYVVLTPPHDGMGTDKQLTDIAATPEMVFVSSEDAGRIFCFSTATGKQVRVIDNLDHPGGLAIGPDGKLYVVAGATVLRMNLDGSAREQLVADLFEPKRIAIAKNGEIFVSVQGNRQQVLRFDRNGKFLNAIGKMGGMIVPGPWVREAMRKPLGLCVAPDGKIWVAEGTTAPKRTSVWLPDGTFMTEFIGPATYSPSSVIDPEEPDYIISSNTRFRIDYATGKSWPVAALLDDDPDPSQADTYRAPMFLGVYRHGFSRVIHFQGRRFLAGGVSRIGLYELFPDRLVGLVAGGQINVNGAWRNVLGIDKNRDGRLELSEMQFIPGGNFYWGNWIDDNLNIYLQDADISLWKLPFEGFDQHGVPIYHAEHAQLLLTGDKQLQAQHPTAGKLPFTGGLGHCMVDHDGNIYIFGGGGRFVRGQGYLDKGACLAKFTPQGKLCWEYRNVLSGGSFNWSAPLSKPGEIQIPCKFTGEFGRYLTIGSYFGQYHILDKETGLYITSITPDMRTDPPLDGMAVLTENFNGAACYVPKLKKYLYTGGDNGARVWEVQGLDNVQFASFPIIITPAQVIHAFAAQKMVYGVAKIERGEKVLLAKPLNITPSGNLSDWKDSDWVTFGVDDQRKARATAAWWSQWGDLKLHLAFDVTDESPMLNKGGNNNLLFKTGAAVEFCLSSADPAAARPDEKPITGDMRILITQLKDEQGREQPIAMLYEPKSARAPKVSGVFVSSTGYEEYDYVAPLKNAQITIIQREGGYTVEASFDAKELGFTTLEVGQKLRADFGVLFSDKGGVVTLVRAMWADDSNELGVSNDIPTESRLHPKRWGWLVLR